MYCPYCSNHETKVLESRRSEQVLRRRRECLSCSSRFTTHEKVVLNFAVIKKDKHEEPFNIEKIKNSLRKSFSKSNEEKIIELAQNIERKILLKKKNTVKTSEIGRITMNELKKHDKMAYLRYASVYKNIDDPKNLEKELQMIA